MEDDKIIKSCKEVARRNYNHGTSETVRNHIKVLPSGFVVRKACLPAGS